MEQEIQKAFKKYISTYFSKRSYEELLHLLDKEMTGIGTSIDELALDTDSAKNIYKCDISQVPSPIDVTIHQQKIQVVAPTVAIVNSVITIRGNADSIDFEINNLRQSVTFVKKQNDWLIAHVHISLPAKEFEEGESYPLKELKEQNLKLKEKIQRKVDELKRANVNLKNEMLEHKRVREKLEKNEKELIQQGNLHSTLLELLPVGVFMVESPSGKPIVVNKFAKELLGRGILPKVSSKNMSQAYKAYKQKTNTQYPTNEMPIIKGMNGLSSHVDDLEVKHPDGSRVLLEIFGSPVFDQKGNVWASLVTFFDITQRKLSEQALRESETTLRAIFDIANIGISITNVSGKYVMFNKWWSNYLGYETDDLYNLTNIDITHPDDKEESKVNFKEVVRGKKDNYCIEKRFIRKNGDTLWATLSVSSIKNSKGEVEYMICMVNDITHKKRMEEELRINEEKFRTLVENLNEIIYILDDKGVVTYISPNVKAISGYNAREVVGTSFLKFVHPDDIRGRQEQFQKILSGIYNPSEYRLVAKNGNSIWMRTSAKPVLKKGKTIGVQGVLTDITNIKLIEAELRKNEARLKELNSAKDKFFSILAHDLKSPFNSILGFLNLLINNIRQNDIYTTEKQIKIIYNSAKHIYSLLENTLTWAGTQSGKIPFNPQVLQISSICNNAIENQILNAHKKNISLSYFESDGLSISADRNMLDTIIRNLISNAIKFTPENGKVDVYAIKNDGEVVVSVTDNGIGISEKNIPKLFNLSEKYSTTGTANEKGTGLGLLICKEFVEQHGGKIWIDTQEGNGTTFSFSLPSKD
ncbi:MAG: PAS domain S-box protein [Bacteroidales bacterium]